MSDVVPAALALLAPQERARLQAGAAGARRGQARVAAACEALGFTAEIAEFFADLPARIAAAHLVVARAGASTVSELAVIGRPAILVPYPARARPGPGRQRRALVEGGRGDGRAAERVHP